MTAKERIIEAMAQYDLAILKKPNFMMGVKKFNILSDMVYRITFVELVLQHLDEENLTDTHRDLFDKLLTDREFYSYDRIFSERHRVVSDSIRNEFSWHPIYHRDARRISVEVNKSSARGVVNTYIQMHELLGKYVAEEKDVVLEMALGENFDKLYAQWIDGKLRIQDSIEKKKEAESECSEMEARIAVLKAENAAMGAEITRRQAEAAELRLEAEAESKATTARKAWWKRLFRKAAI